MLNQYSDVFDYELLLDTIQQWTRPLPQEYISMPLVMVGPSGVGKNRLIRALLKDYEKFFQRVVTHTTRQPRANETNGVDYIFIDKTSFQQLVTKDNYFLEWAQVHNNLYGLSYESWHNVTARHKIPIFEIDIQGAISVHRVSTIEGIKPFFLFIKPVHINRLEERLIARGSESNEEIQMRLSNAQKEMKIMNETTFFDKVLINDDFEKASNELFRFVRDSYPLIPSAARLRMLQRKVKNIRKSAQSNSQLMSKEINTENTQSNSSV